MPAGRDIHSDPPHRVGADRDRAGVRVRLLGDTGGQGAAQQRLPGRAGQLQPGDDHDRPRVRRRHLSRADHPEVVARIIERERPDALLPTLGGQTALNCTVELARSGVLDQYHVEVLGASIDAIDAAEDRGRFKQVMEAAGLETPVGVRPINGRGGARRTPDRLPGDDPAVVHPRVAGRASPQTRTSSSTWRITGWPPPRW